MCSVFRFALTIEHNITYLKWKSHPFEWLFLAGKPPQDTGLSLYTEVPRLSVMYP